MKDMGEYVRTSMNKVLEVSLLAGGIVAAEKNVCGCLRLHRNWSTVCNRGISLNKKAKKPIVDLAVGRLACIVFGILMNLLLLIGLIAVPVAK